VIIAVIWGKYYRCFLRGGTELRLRLFNPKRKKKEKKKRKEKKEKRKKVYGVGLVIWLMSGAGRVANRDLTHQVTSMVLGSSGTAGTFLCLEGAYPCLFRASRFMLLKRK
jgi:hypothetical protein